jgi:histidinol-phosphate aminotransferase
VGFGIGPSDVIDGLAAMQFPFSVSLPAQAAAMAAIDDVEFVAKSRDFNTAELDYLRTALQDLPVTIPPSRANFLLIDTQKNASWLFSELQKRGFIIRPMGGYGLPNAIRVSPVAHEDNVKFTQHLRDLLLS